MLRIALIAYIAEHALYGIPMLVWPGLLWETIAGAEGDALKGLESNRWAGALLVAWGFGAILVLLRPRGQRTFLTTIAIQTSLASGALFYSSVTGEFDVVDAWFRWASVLAIGALALYLWGARWRARDILAR